MKNSARGRSAIQHRAASSPRSRLSVRTTVRNSGLSDGASDRRWTSIAGSVNAAGRWASTSRQTCSGTKRGKVGEQVPAAKLIRVRPETYGSRRAWLVPLPLSAANGPVCSEDAAPTYDSRLTFGRPGGPIVRRLWSFTSTFPVRGQEATDSEPEPGLCAIRCFAIRATRPRLRQAPYREGPPRPRPWRPRACRGHPERPAAA